MSQKSLQYSAVEPPLPDSTRTRLEWGRIYGASRGLAIASAVSNHPGMALVVAPDPLSAQYIEEEIRFFSDGRIQVLVFPDWETLPYDVFSPHEDIVSQRLETLYRLPSLDGGVLVVPVTTLMQRLPPADWIVRSSLLLKTGEHLDLQALRQRLERSGYLHVSQVMAHGELAVRGSLVDVFPMGADHPFRIDLFDEEIESIRVFDPETQTSIRKVEQIRMLPAREFPAHKEAIQRFRKNFRAVFDGDPTRSQVYQEVSAGNMPSGVEYYLPLFFDDTQTLFDYLPGDTLTLHAGDAIDAAVKFEEQTRHRYEERRHDRSRPLMPPDSLYLGADALCDRLEAGPSVSWRSYEFEHPAPGRRINLATDALPGIAFQPRAADPAEGLKRLLHQGGVRVLFAAESAGRREHLMDVLHGAGIRPHPVGGWAEFMDATSASAITVAPLAHGLRIRQPDIAVVTETELFGERARQARRTRTGAADAQAIIRNLNDLHAGAPVVHEEHGVGRYLGLQTLDVGDSETEFLALEYAGGDKLYVPVSSLHLISRYSGASPENAPLHKLGGEQWRNIKRKAAEKARDVAAELLDIHARRAARKGVSFDVDNDEYAAFAAAFPFEETQDQERAILDVLGDMASAQPMDRVVCGDVGFGKTEVSMRAAFVAVQNGRQVAVLAPTTLLTQQHLQNFRDRFADWPVRVEALSRFSGAKAQKETMAALARGEVDIVIGTHKLVQPDVRFKRLGLVVIDEEHRFGVRHKERLKALRAEVDILTLTATPIPRTLNMSLSGLRDLSIIATPPVQRHAIKTFVGQWNEDLVREAAQRELKRGGQLYFLHNEVKSIDRTAAELGRLLPEASIQIAHGQMRERDLEQVMLDFYHQRFSILICTTIIESGIDVPSANTIIINRADKFGLSQLHQLRGRVGRSHHRAYAYMIAPPRSAMTPDAVKRLEAIESLEDLGVGFTLATHDLEIRGAGELLGEGQSGQIQEIGFTLYNELLERAVKALRSGQVPDPDLPLDHGSEVNLGVPAMLPEDYIPDVHTRLILYKRIASADSEPALRDLQVEMIDRFGLLPEKARNLFETTRLKLRVSHLGIRSVEVGPEGGRLVFDANPSIDAGKLVELIQSRPGEYRLDGNDRLRFSGSFPGLEDRMEAVLSLVQNLSLKKAA